MSRLIDGENKAHRVIRTHLTALLLTLALFYLHAHVLFDIAGFLVRSKGWLVEELGPHRTGKMVILGCFITLFALHVAEAALWGLFLRWRQIFASAPDGFYFAAVTITTLGYGDMVLPPPFRQLGPLIAISGVLMFGCSTAFLFLLMQQVWLLQL